MPRAGARSASATVNPPSSTPASTSSRLSSPPGIFQVGPTERRRAAFVTGPSRRSRRDEHLVSPSGRRSTATIAAAPVVRGASEGPGLGTTERYGLEARGPSSGRSRASGRRSAPRASRAPARGRPRRAIAAPSRRVRRRTRKLGRRRSSPRRRRTRRSTFSFVCARYGRHARIREAPELRVLHHAAARVSPIRGHHRIHLVEQHLRRASTPPKHANAFLKPVDHHPHRVVLVDPQPHPPGPARPSARADFPRAAGTPRS